MAPTLTAPCCMHHGMMRMRQNLPANRFLAGSRRAVSREMNTQLRTLVVPGCWRVASNAKGFTHEEATQHPGGNHVAVAHQPISPATSPEPRQQFISQVSGWVPPALGWRPLLIFAIALLLLQVTSKVTFWGVNRTRWAVEHL